MSIYFIVNIIMKTYGRVTLMEGDITEVRAEVIVNAANRYLSGGGGVDGAIRRLAGPKVDEECQKLLEFQRELSPGKVVITSGGRLPHRYIFHVIGPIWAGGGHDESYHLKKCYATCLDLACQKRIQRIAFPSISTGAYGFPKTKAAHIAIGETKRFLSGMMSEVFEEIIFVLYDGLNYSLYEQILDSEMNIPEPSSKWYE